MARIRASILFIVVLVVAGLLPLSAGALGLGEIDLKSALNQPFRAEIPVASESPGDLDGLRVEIASADTFRQFGLDRAGFLSAFEFAVVDQPGGAAVQISSQQPVVEPFVTLLLEVSWAQGRLLREYTVLLDPPVFATESVEPAVAAPTAGPSVATPTPREEMVPTKSSGTAASMPARDRSVVDSGGTYGPVQRNDTLWGIAKQYADTASVSRNQMMLAIYQANPEAFTGNINRLKAGMILRVPSAEEIALGSSEATAEVRRQNEQWRGAPSRQETQSGRLRLVPPPDRDTDAAEPAAPSARTGADRQATGGVAETDAIQGRVSELESELAESRRQLQVRDSELEALQRQLADLARDREAGPVIDAQGLEAPELVPEFDTAEPDAGVVDDAEAPVAVDADATEPEAVTEPAPVDVTPVPAARDDQSLLGALFSNPLVYIALIIVVLLAWLLARRNRAQTDEAGTGRWDALDAGDDDFDEEAHEATTRLRAQPPQDETFVVEEAPASEGTDEGTVAPFTDVSSEDWGGLVDEGETPLERTISTDSAVNLDQADPIAESDFHMAYGLYDQAAELLTRAVEIEPERKDLRLKLLEVYFIWENQDGFLQEATALQEQIGGAADPDWNKVLIMGKQICPDEALFAGEAGSVSSGDSVDLEFGEDGGSDIIDISLDDSGASSVDLEFDNVGADLDLDLTGDGGSEDDSDVLDFDIGGEDEATQIVADDDIDVSGDAPTMETPTIESRSIDDDGESTMETPTIESPAMDSTMESPTIESPAMESTMETPTIESPVGDWDDDAGLRSEQTAEINLDDLDLDLSGLDADSDAVDEDSDAVGGSADFAADTLELDVQSEETQQRPTVSLDDIPDDASALDELAEGDVDSTAEMRNLGVSESSDTVEQPTVGGDTAEQPNLASTQSDTILDIGEPIADNDPTAGLEDAVASGVEGATMTEVGTKLDLARAYIDMGDPDGARSILNEVLEEAREEQRQEAQKLLDDLTD